MSERFPAPKKRLSQNQKTAGQKQNPKKKPDANAHPQASGFRHGLYEIPRISV